MSNKRLKIRTEDSSRVRQRSTEAPVNRASNQRVESPTHDTLNPNNLLDENGMIRTENSAPPNTQVSHSESGSITFSRQHGDSAPISTETNYQVQLEQHGIDVQNMSSGDVRQALSSGKYNGHDLSNQDIANLQTHQRQQQVEYYTQRNNSSSSAHVRNTSEHSRIQVRNGSEQHFNVRNPNGESAQNLGGRNQSVSPLERSTGAGKQRLNVQTAKTKTNSLPGVEKVRTGQKIDYRVNPQTGELETFVSGQKMGAKKSTIDGKYTQKLNTRQQAMTSKINTRNGSAVNVNAKTRVHVGNNSAKSKFVLKSPSSKTRANIGGKFSSKTSFAKPSGVSRFNAKGTGISGRFSGIRNAFSNMSGRLSRSGGGLLTGIMAGVVAFSGVSDMLIEETGAMGLIPSAGQYYMNGEEPTSDEWMEIEQYVDSGYSYTINYDPKTGKVGESKIKNDKILVSQKAVDSMLIKEDEYLGTLSGLKMKSKFPHFPLDSRYQNESYVTSPYGLRDDPNNPGQPDGHDGIDIGVPAGTRLYAVDSGNVVKAHESGNAGYHVVIDHGNGIFTEYMHLSKFMVKAGDKVKAGDTIGFTGGIRGTVGAGNSTGAHLHFGVIVSDHGWEDANCRVDPAPYIGLGGGSTNTNPNSSSSDSETIQIKELTIDGEKQNLTLIDGDNYQSIVYPYHYIGTSTKEKNITTTDDTIMPSNIPANQQGDEVISISYSFKDTQVYMHYYPHSSVTQYLGAITPSLYKSKPGYKVAGWSYDKNSTTIQYGTHQELTYNDYIQLKEHLADSERIVLYPVWILDEQSSTIMDVQVVSKEDGDWYLGTSKASDSLAKYFRDSDFSLQYAYVDEEGTTTFVNDESDVLSAYNRNALYKAILTMATIATGNSSEYYPRTYVAYCEYLLDKAIGEQGSCSISLTTRPLIGTAGTSDGVSWSENGVTYEADRVVMSCNIVVYVTASVEGLMSRDDTTSDSFAEEGNPLFEALQDDSKAFIKNNEKKTNVFSLGWNVIKSFFDSNKSTADVIAEYEEAMERPEIAKEHAESITSFDGWTEDNKKSVIETYEKYTDEEFREMYHIVYPPMDVYMTGNDDAAFIFSILVNSGYSAEAACGILGNLQYVSNMNPKLKNGDKYGLLQTDLTSLEDFASQFGEKWPNITVATQAKFIISRLEEGQNFLPSYSYGSNGNLDQYVNATDGTSYLFMPVSDFKTLKDAEQATWSYCAAFERAPYTVWGMETRVKYAKEFLSRVVYMSGNISGDIVGALASYKKMADDDEHYGYCWIPGANFGLNEKNSWRDGLGGYGDYDCGSSISRALMDAGLLPEATIAGGWYEPGYVTPLLENGFEELPYRGMDNLVAGDILVSGGHTEWYIGDGKLAGAHGNSGGESTSKSIDNPPNPGDQSGGEWDYGGGFYDGGWQRVYRYKGSGGIPTNTSSDAENSVDKTGSITSLTKIAYLDNNGRYYYNNVGYQISATAFSNNKYELGFAATASKALPVGSIIRVVDAQGTAANTHYYVIATNNVPSKLTQVYGNDYIYLYSSQTGDNLKKNPNGLYSNYTNAKIYVMDTHVSNINGFHLKGYS